LKQERFILVKRNDPNYMSYYVIQAPDSYVDRKLKTERQHFPNLEVLLDFKCGSNSKTLYARIKDKFKVDGVVFEGNNLELEGTSVTEQNLTETLNMIQILKHCTIESGVNLGINSKLGTGTKRKELYLKVTI
jgi:hypothetical protein